MVFFLSDFLLITLTYPSAKLDRNNSNNDIEGLTKLALLYLKIKLRTIDDYFLRLYFTGNYYLETRLVDMRKLRKNKSINSDKVIIAQKKMWELRFSGDL